MKLPSTFLALSALLAAGPFAHAAPQVIAGQPVLWSVHFDAQRLRSGVGQELFKTLDPILTVLSGDKATGPGGKLESFAAFGLQPLKDAAGSEPPILSGLHFSAEGGGISQRFEAISKKHMVPMETVVGYPAIHFEQEGKEVWIAKYNDQQLFLSTSRELIELVLKSDAAALALPLAQVPNEILGGKVEIKSILQDKRALKNSELLKLLSQLDFRLVTKGEELNLDATAELDGERSAKRAARMIDGMVAMMSMHDTSGVPWDERLTLDQEGPNLSMHVHLEPQEAKDLFDAFAREMAKQTKGAKDDNQD